MFDFDDFYEPPMFPVIDDETENESNNVLDPESPEDDAYDIYCPCTGNCHACDQYDYCNPSPNSL